VADTAVSGAAPSAGASTGTSAQRSAKGAAPSASGGGRGPRAWLVCAAALGWLAFLLVEKAADGRIWLGELVGIVPPFLFALMPLLLAVLLPLARRLRWWTAGALALSLALGLGQAGLNLAALGSEGKVPPGSVHIVAWNTNSWNQILGTKDDFYAFLKDRSADVYLLQEYQRLGADRRTKTPLDDMARLREEFPGYHIAAQGELVTVSRYPVVGEPAVGPARDLPADADWQARYRAGKVLRTDLLIAGQVVSVYNVHMPVWNSMPDGMLSGAFYRHMREQYDPRRAQYAGLEADVAANRNPLVLAGDFNATAAMSDLDPLRERLDDAAGASDDVAPTSWEEGGWKPFWRTDWAFTGQGATADRYAFAEPRKLSDHALQDLWVSVAPGRTGR
jgi:endonuclease/exonuclease/phosphatase (EEP) superfamily protein YafD